jgi:hypothetical protein
LWSLLAFKHLTLVCITLLLQYHYRPAVEDPGRQQTLPLNDIMLSLAHQLPVALLPLQQQLGVSPTQGGVAAATAAAVAEGAGPSRQQQQQQQPRARRTTRKAARDEEAAAAAQAAAEHSLQQRQLYAAAVEQGLLALLPMVGKLSGRLLELWDGNSRNHINSGAYAHTGGGR